MIRTSVSSSTIFLPDIISNYSQSELPSRLQAHRVSGSRLPARSLTFSNGSGSSTIRDPIVSLPNDGFRVLRPIPVVFEDTTDGWIAWFEHAGIGMSGATMTEAKKLLAHDIQDAFILFTEAENKLGPGPISQLEVLRLYIAWEHEHYEE